MPQAFWKPVRMEKVIEFKKIKPLTHLLVKLAW